MTITINRLAPAGSITPFMIVGFDAGRPSGTIVHRIIGASAPAVTLSAAGSKAGRYTFLCLDRASALALEAFHATPSMFSLTDSDQPAFDLQYVLAEGGEIRLALDPATRRRWTVQIDVQGVA